MLDKSIREKLAAVEARYEELNSLMADPAVATNHGLLRQYGQEVAEMEDLVQFYRRYTRTSEQMARTQGMLDDGLDDEMAALEQAGHGKKFNVTSERAIITNPAVVGPEKL